MKSIVIRQLTLLNFKGIRNLTVDFDLNETNIFGYNGTGKTTIFDAFTWLLFGKDSKDRKDFNIKTLDANNQPIERIPHEVTACIEVNGEEINLKKCYNEVWTKKRGSAVETFNGHSVECFYNDVPCSVTEYAKKIAELLKSANTSINKFVFFVMGEGLEKKSEDLSEEVAKQVAAMKN